MKGLETPDCYPRGDLGQEREGQVTEVVPPCLGAQEMSRPELPQDPGAWGRWRGVLSSGGSEEEGGLSNRPPEVVESPIVQGFVSHLRLQA